jgi:hypothetical protein
MPSTGSGSRSQSLSFHFPSQVIFLTMVPSPVEPLNYPTSPAIGTSAPCGFQTRRGRGCMRGLLYPLPERIFMMMRCPVFQVPSGTSDNSPALQRWVPDSLFPRPGGTVVGSAGFSAVPPGRIVYDRPPTVETVGYFQTVPPGRNGPLKKNNSRIILKILSGKGSKTDRTHRIERM